MNFIVNGYLKYSPSLRIGAKKVESLFFLQSIVKKMAFFLNNLDGTRIQKITSKVYVKNLAMNSSILKLELCVKTKIDISGGGYTY